jgi:lipoyl(octanoyl) transferase
MTKIEVHQLYTSAYQKVLDIQKRTHIEVQEHRRFECIYLVEHHPVITLGRRGGLIVQNAQSKKTSVPVVQTQRGGLATCHNYGQLVIYPIIHIKKRKIGIKRFICLLLQSIKMAIDSLFEIEVYISAAQTGLWYQEKKIASIGMRIEKGVSYHGIAINVYNDLSLFQLIEPCGFSSTVMANIKSMCTSNPIEALPKTSADLMDFGLIISKIMIDNIQEESKNQEEIKDN